ncbi:uncharacterized protein LOC125683084 [Ostrea edulis]|uniref:uncharacterized protein LOC125683084 n=1 Tax=Ostrea edulis TaxID=37623 RepID=UPI00209478AC|nr:uncharacterized protein LOC125683084 [Ostrea edulis]
MVKCNIYNIVKESYHYWRIYWRCKLLLRKNIALSTALSNPKDGGVPHRMPGIYTFKQKRKVIYLGMSSCDIRNRLKAHVNNNDHQEVGLYLQKWHLRAITISWVQETNAGTKEKQYMEMITNLQGNAPILNKTSGNSKKSSPKKLLWRILK